MIYDNPIFQEASFRGRDNFGEFLNSQNLRGIAIEIGVHRGVFARQFLSQWTGTYLWCVDPWGDLPEYSSQTPMLCDDETGEIGSSNRLDDMVKTAERLKEYERRAGLIRTTSGLASRLFDNESVDFVHIDGNHLRKYFNLDLRLWWPKIKPEGVMAGHDLCFPEEPDFPWTKEIMPTVIEFATRYEYPIYVVEDTGPRSWFMRKREK